MARLLGVVASPNSIVLTQHATHALNFAILGVGLKSGDHVITTVTEHNSVLRPLFHLEARLGLRLSIIGLDEEGGLDLMAFQQALADKPRFVVLNHVSNVTGRVNPVAQFFGLAKAAGAVTLLDASQSMGYLPVVDAPGLGADMVAFTGHKGLRGPLGVGGLYVSPDLELEQVMVGGTGVRSNLRFHPSEMPIRLEAGTPNVPAIMGLVVALRWLETEGEVFQKRETKASSALREGLAAISGVRVFDGGVDPTGIISFQVAGWEVDEAGYVLAESFGIICRTGLHCAPLIHAEIGAGRNGTIRFSPSGFTTDQEIETAIFALRSLAR